MYLPAPTDLGPAHWDPAHGAKRQARLQERAMVRQLIIIILITMIIVITTLILIVDINRNNDDNNTIIIIAIVINTKQYVTRLTVCFGVGPVSSYARSYEVGPCVFSS